MTLTNIKCSTAKPKEKPYKLGDAGGMYLEIMPNGSKYWRLKYRFLGKEKRLALGVYPETSLAEAREKRDAARKLIKASIDPSQAKKEEKLHSLVNAENTFEVLAREWHEQNKTRWTENHGKDILHRFEMDIFSEIGGRPIRDLTPPEILAAIRKIENRGAFEMAKRALQNCGKVFRFAVATGRIESDPTRDLKGALKHAKKGHFAALDTKDLPAFLDALNRNEARLYPQTIRAVRLLMLTFTRTSELIGAKWEEFDFEEKVWNIPPERMKMRKPHIVPLSRQVIAILEEQRELTGKWEWVFPNQVRPKSHMSNNTVLMALRRMGYQGQMTGHGFRALAMSTIKEKLGFRLIN